MPDTTAILQEAREILEQSILYYDGRAVGTVAATDPSMEALNYDQCFIRDFVPSALFFLVTTLAANPCGSSGSF